MKYSEILKNEHFNNLAAIMRIPALSAGWREQHAEVAFWQAMDELSDLNHISDVSQFVNRFCQLLTELTTADPRLTYTEQDVVWFVEAMDNEYSHTIAALLLAWSSAPDTLLTPAEVAGATGTHESNWRNKAAAGEIPGAVKKGKQWLLPRSVLRSQGLDV